MPDKKIVFVASIEDERQRDFLKGQSLITTSPFEFVDMSVKEAYKTDWKDKDGSQSPEPTATSFHARGSRRARRTSGSPGRRASRRGVPVAAAALVVHRASQSAARPFLQ